MIAAIRIVSLVMTLVMLFTLFPTTTVLGDDIAQASTVSRSISTADELSEQTFELTPEDGV